MSLVEAEEVGPVEGDAPQVTPPRPPHRRVSVSLVFTLTVLIGTVVAIYLAFPARHNVLVTEAIALHRDAAPAWDLTAPSAPELHAWVLGVVGKDAPFPKDGAVTGVRRIEILDRGAALARLRIGGDEVTYLVQRARGVTVKRTERTDGDLRAMAWKQGAFTFVVVGPDATFATWRAAFP